MKKIILVATGALLLGIIVGYAIATSVGNESYKSESLSYLEAQTRRKVWSTCKSDGHPEDICKSLMIQDVGERLNGETPVPDGYVFTFSDKYSPEKASLVYRIEAISRGSQAGRIFPVERLSGNDLNEQPE